MPTAAVAPRSIVVHTGAEAIDCLGADWGALAHSPFLTPAWLRPWWAAFGRDEPVVVAARTDDGTLVAGALLARSGRVLRAAANVHSGDWDVVGDDTDGREAVWATIARLGPTRLRLRALASTDAAARVLDAAGYRAVVQPDVASPYAALPSTFDELLAARSSNLRQQWRRRGRALARAGRVTFRVRTEGGPGLERDLDALLGLEAAGWKGRAGSAIAGDPRTVRLYRAFAHGAAEAGLLRLYALELDGIPVAMDLGCRIGAVGFLVKTTFDERLGHLSPGLVLRGEVLRASIEEGLSGYDFLGAADAYKLRWTDEVRVRCTLDARPGVRGAALAGYHRVRPTLVHYHRLLSAWAPLG